ncbi:hypothetical protein KGM_203013 [Danaus plexippus plexippus]|uniref:Uncharacterized protein n=1 Tax=Danaus plexippus plexippus TaxID=278856 RepID=A0A212EKI1_DANPL|nr:hypothetical protein KGM_203013 [Danaus plexippus plexippus]
MSDRDRSSPSLTDTPLKTYIGRHDDDYPLINGNASLRVWRAADRALLAAGAGLASRDNPRADRAARGHWVSMPAHAPAYIRASLQLWPVSFCRSVERRGFYRPAGSRLTPTGMD